MTTLLAVAETERNLMVKRTQEGKALAKQSEFFREGRPTKHSKLQAGNALELLKTHTYKESRSKTDIKKRTLIRRENEQGKKQEP